MPNDTKPTAGAMRAAIQCGLTKLTHSESWQTTKARVIDRETGLPELLAALEGLLKVFPCYEDDEERLVFKTEEGLEYGCGEEIDAARAALAKAKGGE